MGVSAKWLRVRPRLKSCRIFPDQDLQRGRAAKEELDNFKTHDDEIVEPLAKNLRQKVFPFLQRGVRSGREPEAKWNVRWIWRSPDDIAKQLGMTKSKETRVQFERRPARGETGSNGRSRWGYNALPENCITWVDDKMHAPFRPEPYSSRLSRSSTAGW